jgi:hypothetical protein
MTVLLAMSTARCSSMYVLIWHLRKFRSSMVTLNRVLVPSLREGEVIED